MLTVQDGSAHHTCAYNSCRDIMHGVRRLEIRCKIEDQHSLWLGMLTALQFVLTPSNLHSHTFVLYYHIILYINFGIIVIISQLQNHQNQDIGYYSPAVCNRAKTRR